MDIINDNSNYNYYIYKRTMKVRLSMPIMTISVIELNSLVKWQRLSD